MKSTLTLFLIVFSLIAFGQTDKLNQFDSNGKKHGKWVIYWDKSWKQVDSVNGIYARYTFYDHGDNLNAMGPCGSNNWKLVSRSKSENKIGNAVLLDGEYDWTDSKDVVRFSFIIKNGEFVKYKEFSKSGVLTTIFDYTKLYNNQPHSYAIMQYKKNGELKSTSYAVKDMNSNRYNSRPK